MSGPYRDYPDSRYDRYRERPPPASSRHPPGARPPAWRDAADGPAGPPPFPPRRGDWHERERYDRDRDFRQRDWYGRGDRRRDADLAGPPSGGWGRARDYRGERVRDEGPSPRGRYPPPGPSETAADPSADPSGPSSARADAHDDGSRGERFNAPRTWGGRPPPGPYGRGSWRRSPSPSHSNSPRSSSKRSSPAPSRRPPSPPSAGSYRSRETWDDTEHSRSRRVSNETNAYEACMNRSESASLLAPPSTSQPEASPSASRSGGYDVGSRRGSMGGPGERDSWEMTGGASSAQPPPGPAGYGRSASSASLATPGAAAALQSPMARPSERPSFNNDYLQPRLQQAYAASLTSIRSLHEMHNSAPQRALRKALQDLADAEVELAGARVRTSVTEASLEKIREEAELWSTESARLEIEQRNSGIEGYWKARFNEKPMEAAVDTQ